MYHVGNFSTALMSMHLRLLSGLAMAATVCASPAAQGPLQPVTWTVALGPAAASRAPGGPLAALVTAKMDEGWHIYSTQELPDGPRPLRIDLVPGGPAEPAGAMLSPEPEREFDDAFSQVTAYYKETATFRVPLKIRAQTKPAAASVAFDISFQACDGRMCLPGRTVRVSAPVVIARPK